MPLSRPSLPDAPDTAPIVFVGALHVDELCWPSAPLVPHASNPVHRTRRVGGVAANAARAARGLHTGAVRLVAALGDDADARWLLETLAAAGVDCRAVEMRGRASGCYTVVHDVEGELFVGLSDVGIAETLEAEAVRARAGRARPAAVVLDANLHPDCLAASLADGAPGDNWRGVPRVALTVSPHKASRFAPHLATLDLLFCNRREAAALGAADNATAPDALADRLLAAGAVRFVLTDGPAPVLVHEPRGRRYAPVPLTAAGGSVNGAGDALAGATLAHWLAHDDLHAAVREAGLPAARTVLSSEPRRSDPDGA